MEQATLRSATVDLGRIGLAVSPANRTSFTPLSKRLNAAAHLSFARIAARLGNA
jgi:hypothetical protein